MLNFFQVSDDYSAEIEGDVQDATDAVFDKEFVLPGDFLVVPGLGIESGAAAGF